MSEEHPLPTVVPMLAYENGPAAMDWLSKAFGFVERARMVDDGVLGHGEMALGDGVVMMATPSPHYQSPKHHRQVCAAADKWLSTPFVIDGVLLAVDDLDAHYAQATAAGAIVLQEPTDSPYGRTYRVEDLEGHRWMFIQRG